MDELCKVKRRIMKEYIIIGDSFYSRRIKKYIEMTSFGVICAFVVDALYKKDTLIDGIAVISLDELRQMYLPDQVELVMGIGYTEMGDLRKCFFERCKALGYSFTNFIHPSAIISPDVNLGEGNIILENVIIEPDVSIGNANLIFGGCQIGHGSSVKDYSTFASRVLLSSSDQIGDHCYFGDGSIVSPNVTLGDYVLLGTMTCANRNLESNAVLIQEKSKVVKGNKSKVYFDMFVK